MSPTAEQTEERSQHDEEDERKRSLRRFSIVVQRLHWKEPYLHRKVLHLTSTLIDILSISISEIVVELSLLSVNINLYIHIL